MGCVSYSRIKDCEIIEYTDKPFHYPEHNHTSVFTLGFVLDGSVTLISEGMTKQYGTGSCFVIPPFAPHELILPEKYRLLTLCLQSGYVTSHTPSQICEKLCGSSMIIDRLQPDTLRKAVDELCDCLPFVHPTEPFKERAMLLRQSPEDHLDVDEMAQTESYSKYHFIRAFKRAVGLTPHRFQLQSRIRKAQKLIESGMPLADVAAAAGFFDQSHFIKSFKASVGLTPLEYRQCFVPAEPED